MSPTTPTTEAGSRLWADLTPDPAKPLLRRGRWVLGDMGVRIAGVEAEAAADERQRAYEEATGLAYQTPLTVAQWADLLARIPAGYRITPMEKEKEA